MPARHTSLQDGLLLEADSVRRLWSTKEGVGETSGQTAGSNFRGVRSSKAGPAEETSFLRSVRILQVRNFTGALQPVKSGPDVFADALVPLKSARLLPRRLRSPRLPFRRTLASNLVTTSRPEGEAAPKRRVRPHRPPAGPNPKSPASRKIFSQRRRRCSPARGRRFSVRPRVERSVGPGPSPPQSSALD